MVLNHPAGYFLVYYGFNDVIKLELPPYFYKSLYMCRDINVI